MEIAKKNDCDKITKFYKDVIDAVNLTDIKLGWNIDIYPNEEFVANAIEKGQMLIVKNSNKQVVAAAVVNHDVNAEYDDIDWEVKGSKSQISTIHALAVSPKERGTKLSYDFLTDIENLCRENGDKAIHLDVIDTNIPAYKLYIRNGYKEIDNIKMYYEVVGTREFWMLERKLDSESSV